MRTHLVFFASASTAGLLLAMSGCASGVDPREASPDASVADDGGIATQGSRSTPSEGPDLATVAGYCAARAEAECSGAVVAACELASAHACESARAASCKATLPQATTYQPGKAKACVAAVAKAYATATMTGDALTAIGVACGPVLFAGRGAARASCSSDYDCDSAKGLRCIVPTPEVVAGMGQCFVPVAIASGGDCSPQGSVCSTGEHCDPQGLVCTADYQVSQACNPPGWPCAAGLRCSAPGLPFATCEAGGGADGDACMTATDCVSGLCDKATGQASGSCASSVVLTSLNALCAGF